MVSAVGDLYRARADAMAVADPGGDLLMEPETDVDMAGRRGFVVIGEGADVPVIMQVVVAECERVLARVVRVRARERRSRGRARRAHTVG